MYCRYCGKQIADDSIFCQHCGEKLSQMTNSENSTTIKQGLKAPEPIDENTKKKLEYFKGQRKSTLKNILIWIGICVVVSILDFWEDGDYDAKDLFWWCLIGSIIVALFTNEDELTYRLNKIFPPKKKLPRKIKPNTKYCALTGKEIIGDYVLIKRKHILSSYTTTESYGWFNQNRIYTTHISYLWDVYSVSPEAYDKLKKKCRVLKIYIPLFVWLIIHFGLHIAYAIGKNDSWSLNLAWEEGAITFFPFIASLIAFIIFMIMRWFSTPHLYKEGIVNSLVQCSDTIPEY